MLEEGPLATSVRPQFDELARVGSPFRRGGFRRRTSAQEIGE